MKKILFGIALILFALLLLFADPSWIHIRTDWIAFMIGFVGLVIAGVGAFTKDQ